MRDTIDMAREAGFDTHTSEVAMNVFFTEELKAFEALVRADERNKVWSRKDWTEYEQAIAAAEREACAELVYNSPPSDEYESPLKAVYDAIRARGETK